MSRVAAIQSQTAAVPALPELPSAVSVNQLAQAEASGPAPGAQTATI